MKNFAQALTTVLEARNAEKPSNDLVTAINNTKSHARPLDQLFGQKAFAPIAKQLLNSLSIVSPENGNRENFVAVKVAVKIINTANGLAKGEKNLLDPYSKTIIENLVSLHSNDQGVSNKSALVALSNAITYTEDDQKQKLTSKYGCSAGTAGTQASSTRMMLRSLDICEVLKSKRGDTLTLKDNERAQMLVALFTGKPVALKEEPAPVVKKTTAKKAAAAPKAETAPVTEAPKAAAKKAAAKKTATPKAEKAAPVADAKPAKKAAAKKPTAKKETATA